MTKTKNKLKIVGLLLTVVMTVSLLGIFSLTASSAAGDLPQASDSVTEATDVYWYVHNGKLLLSPEQGSSGYYKWSKENIAAVQNESDVPWNTSRASITSVIIYGPIAPPSTAFWFKDTGLTSFSASFEGTVYLDMRFAVDASRMFAGCSALAELDLAGVEAPLVENIESAFDGCSSLKALDISCFDGAPISNMMNAFYGCSSLKALDISYLDGAPLDDMAYAFGGCAGLEALDVSGLDISGVTDFSGVFQGCAALKSLDLSGLDGRRITTLKDTFNGCSSLTSLTLGDGFPCENVTDMTNTFASCKKLTSLDLSGFSTSKVTNMSGMFYFCEALEELTLGGGFVCSGVTDMERMFFSCKALKSLDTSGWNASKVKNMEDLFGQCTALEALDLSGFDGAEPTNIRSMFKGAASLTAIDLSGINTSGVTTLYELFKDCASLQGFDLTSINTSAVTNMGRVFGNCTSLTSFSFVGVDTSKVETMEHMFSGCKNLASVDLSGINSAKVTSVTGMFSDCSALKRLDLSDFDVAEGLSSNFFLTRCSGLEMITAPKIIPEGVSITLGFYTFYNGEAEIEELTSQDQNKVLVRKFDIKYLWKNGTQTVYYPFEPSYYYYGKGATISAVASENGYTFGGWTRGASGDLVTEITETDTGEYVLYAKLTAHQPVAPVLSGSGDAIVTYGEGFEVMVDFAEDEYHTYWIEWYRTTYRGSSGGVQVSGLRNTRGFTIAPMRFEYGITIEEEVYFYCTVTATRKDNGLSKTVSSPSIKVYVERAQAVITVHPTAIEGLIYNGSPQAVSTFGESNFGTVSYSFYEADAFTGGNNKQTNAGSGILYYRVFDGRYYKGTELYTLEYTIEAAPPKVTWNEESVTVEYTGEEAAIAPPSVSLLGSDTYDGPVSYSYTGTSSGTGLPVQAGTYSVVASIAEGGNYKEASSKALTLVISQAEPTYDVEPSPIDGLVYNGGEQALASLGETACGVVEFSLDQSSWSAEVPKGKHAGEYTVYYRIKGDHNHVDGAIGSLTASIGRKPITVAAEDTTICINGTYTLTYGVEGLVHGEALPVDVTLHTDATVSTAGSYAITVSGAQTSDNYTVTYESGTLTVRNHDYNGAVTASPTCIAGGEMTYTCAHDSTHSYTEPIPVDENAHSWNGGVCVYCSESCTHVHSDRDELCDECGVEDAFSTVTVGEASSVLIKDPSTYEYVKFIPEQTGTYILFSNMEDAGNVYPCGEVLLLDGKNVAYDWEYMPHSFFCVFEAEAGTAYYLPLSADAEDFELRFTVDYHVTITHQPSLWEPYVALGWGAEAGYQWYTVVDFEGVLLEGETSSRIQNPVIGQTYYCVAILSDGSALQSDEFLYTYMITQQPTGDEPRVEANDDTDATYQWYIFEDIRIEVTDGNAEGVGADGTSKSFYTAGKGWTGHAHHEVFYFGYSSYLEYFEIYLKAGQTIELIPDGDVGILGIWDDRPSNYDARMSAKNVGANTPVRITAVADGYYQAYSFGNSDATVKAYVVTEPTAIEGATEPSYTPSEHGPYACLVTFRDGTNELSAIFEKHTYADAWSKNDTHHWHECICGDRADYAEHSFGDFAVTTDPSCTEAGSQAKTCPCGHSVTETLPALGHRYDHDCDSDCNACAEARTPALHLDADEDRICDVCGAELPKDGLSGGAIAGIAVGSAAAVGLGGFSLFWFVIKKKKWSDLIRIFKP